MGGKCIEHHRVFDLLDCVLGRILLDFRLKTLDCAKVVISRKPLIGLT